MHMAQKSELPTRLGRFEVLSAIVDSGAIVPVMNPSTGSKYEVLAGSANGTECEIASGDTLEDLGEKKMAVLTAEGTLGGYSSRCAEVTKALQSVRALVASGHAVCFGLGDGTEHHSDSRVRRLSWPSRCFAMGEAHQPGKPYLL